MKNMNERRKASSKAGNCRLSDVPFTSNPKGQVNLRFLQLLKWVLCTGHCRNFPKLHLRTQFWALNEP